MNFFKKLFHLPSPVELGWSKYNALESRAFSYKAKGKTWEDWEEHVKQLHPFKFFLVKTLPSFLRYKIWFKFAVPAETLRYWLVSHLVPSRRYHMLDLRQPIEKHEAVNIDAYRYGWTDVCDKMLYALFNLLGEYLDGEMPTDLTEHYSAEEIKNDPALANQQANLEEARAIHRWWTIQRKRDWKEYYELQHKWSEAKEDEEFQKKLWQDVQDMEQRLENESDEMVARLMKIRRTLWT